MSGDIIILLSLFLKFMSKKKAYHGSLISCDIVFHLYFLGKKNSVFIFSSFFSAFYSS